MSELISGLYPLYAGRLMRMRQAGQVPSKPCVVSINATPTADVCGRFVHVAVPDGFRPYRLNWSPVAGLDVMIAFSSLTTFDALFELYQCLLDVRVTSITAQRLDDDLIFILAGSR